MKYMFAGLGSIGRRHLGNLKPLLSNGDEIIAFRTGLGTKNDEEELEKYGVKSYYDINEAFRQKPDVVFVTNSSSLHMPVALEAAKHGCHLFIEKPLSDNMNGVDELIKLAEKKKLVSLVGYCIRFHPNLIEARRLIDGGKIGRVLSARITVGDYLPNYHPSEDYRKSYTSRRDLGGGVILTMIHELDYAQWLFGPIEDIFAFADKLSNLEIDVEDTAEILMRSKSGAIIEVHMDYTQKAPERKMEIVGDKGKLVWDYIKNELVVFTESGGWKDCNVAKGFEKKDMYIREIKHFLKCVEGKEKPVVDLREAKKSLEIALAAKESAKTGKLIRL